MREFKSDEKYDISKFLNFEEGVYDVINSPFLIQVQQLPTVEYYHVNNGYKEIDLISSEKYGEPFLAYLIQFYNNDFRETFPEGTILKLFSIDDLNEIYHDLATLSNTEE
jgi:hypothetical protein